MFSLKARSDTITPNDESGNPDDDLVESRTDEAFRHSIEILIQKQEIRKTKFWELSNEISSEVFYY